LIDHPSSEELAAFVRAGLPETRTREVVRHLLLPCAPCATAVFEAMGRILAPGPVDEDEYDAALDRAMAKAVQYEQQLQQRKVEAERLEEVFAQGGVLAVQDVPWEADDLALFDALLARSWALRHDKPAEMVRFATLAVKLAQRLDACIYGVRQLADLQCRAWSELGNAHRVSDNHRQATHALVTARGLFELGTGDAFLGVRLTELEASLAADRRDFTTALLNLTLVYRFYRRHKNDHLAGRTLILRGLYLNYADRIDDAIEALRQGRALLDPDRDPDLHYSAAHNELLCLADSGRVAEARVLRIKRSRELSLDKGRVSQVRLRAIDGRLDAAQRKYERAEAIFREVKQDFLGLNRSYHAAIAGLDLATVLFRQGKAAEAKQEALGAVEMFLALRIGEQAFAAVIVLRTFFEMRMATPALIQNLADFMRRTEMNPEAPFTPPPSVRIP